MVWKKDFDIQANLAEVINNNAPIAENIDFGSIYSGMIIHNNEDVYVSELTDATISLLKAKGADFDNCEESIYLSTGKVYVTEKYVYYVTDAIIVVLDNFENDNDDSALLDLQCRWVNDGHVWRGFKYKNADFVADMYFVAIDCGICRVFTNPNLWNTSVKGCYTCCNEDLHLLDEVTTTISRNCADLIAKYSNADLEIYGLIVYYLTITRKNSLTPLCLIDMARDLMSSFCKWIKSDKGRQHIQEICDYENTNITNSYPTKNGEVFYIGDSRDIVWYYVEYYKTLK